LPSATTWTVATTAATASPYTITSGLTTCTEYQVRVKANCSATSSSAYSNTTSFTTVGCVPCPLPTGLTVGTITTNSANVTWSNTGASSYTLQYKLALSTTAAWTTVTTTTNSYAITGLATCKYYIVRVAPNCAPNNVSNFTSTKTFKTTGCILAPNTDVQAFVTSPNPGSNVLNVSYVVEKEGVVTIEIVNTQGQIVSRLMNENVTSGYYQNTFNEVENLNNGVYFITLQSADGEKRVQRWVKAN
jgi:Secretion system C-terminal sorting domain/Fibronectin type III domain